MTERFIVDDDGIVTDMLDLSMYIDNEDCCEKLNELDEKNKQLESKIKSITEILNEDIGYIDSFKKIEEVLK